MTTMISTMTGAVSGVGVKFSHFEKWPSTNIHVRMPIVEPRPRALMTAALMGSTSEPNARNIRIVVTLIKTTITKGSLSKTVSMESCSSAGVPPTYIVTPLGTGISRSCLTFAPAVFRSTRAFWMTLTLVSPSVLTAWRRCHI
ncbi:Uncharacterised protein [Mycobacteroides abscessus subsp. abscessus]|nr:Uncharacterised protein [Mycobacteroides abscessus subsp. abscessus]SKU38767.1 Uncharacterised protein [Mycobacteroides abscessus subsp. abscessus]